VTQPTSLTPAARWSYLGLAAFVVILWFAVLPTRPLFNTDEGRYAEIPREMLSGGDWVIPHLNGVAYIEKPPLQYWATALSLWVFGQDEFGARAYTAACALGTLAVVWLLALRLWGAAAAWRAAATLASLLLFVTMGQLLTLDMSLTFFMTLALAAFVLAQPSQPAEPVPNSSRRWMLAAWVATALGVLTKGLVAAAIPAAVLVLYSLYSRDFSPWRRLYLTVGLPLFLAISVPWHWLAARRLSDFLEFFFVHEHVARYLTPSADREEPWWFFGVVFVLGSLPWALPAVRVVATGWRRGAPGRFDPRLFLWMWLVFVCVFFSLSDSKLIPYILPVMPALALLIAASPPEVVRRDVAMTATLTLGVAVALAMACVWAPRYLPATPRNAYFLLLSQPVWEIAALLAVAGVVALLQRHRDVTRAAVFLSVGWCLGGLLLMRGAAAVAPLYSGVGLARSLGILPRDIPLYSVGTYDQSLPFYSQQTVKLVAYRGELDYGLRHDPGAEIPSVTEFIGQWRALTDGYAVMETSMYDDLKSRGIPMREIARNSHRVLVARR
jgi:4-amino-4-deoxy-L-arabinose transferase-like glycosyltransferase